MGYFDGIENQKELEIYFRLFISALVSLHNDLTEEEEIERVCEEQPGILVIPIAKPLVTNCKTP